MHQERIYIKEAIHILSSFSHLPRLQVLFSFNECESVDPFPNDKFTTTYLATNLCIKEFIIYIRKLSTIYHLTM